MKYLTTLLLLSLMPLMLSGVSWAQTADRFANVEIKAQHVQGSVHMLQGAGGNIGVSVGADGTLIVDDQFAPLADRILAALGELGGDRPKLILNTHWHGDHTGANPEMGKTGTIIAHDNVRLRLLGADNFARSGLPVVTFDKHLNVHFNDDSIVVMHLPTGHTDGDSMVWFKQANVLHMGDQFFNQRFPFIDIASGGSVDGFIANTEQVLSMVPADIKIIPGHGPLADKEDLADTLAAVKQSVALVRQGLNDNQPVAEIAAVIDQDFTAWASGFIDANRWVQIIEADLDR